MRAEIEYLRAMASELAAMCEKRGWRLLAFLFRMAEAEAGQEANLVEKAPQKP